MKKIRYRRFRYRRWVKVVAAIMAIVGAVGIYYCPLTSKTNTESRIKGMAYMAMCVPFAVIVNTDYRWNNDD